MGQRTGREPRRHQRLGFGDGRPSPHESRKPQHQASVLAFTGPHGLPTLPAGLAAAVALLIGLALAAIARSAALQR